MQIIINHKDIKQKDVSLAFTTYHIWEHLFIRILETILFNCKVKISGMTTSKNTILIIEGEYEICVDDILTKLEKWKVKKKWVDIERNIILNELPCMENLYGIQYRGEMDNGSYSQIIEFRKEKYDWNNVLIDTQKQDDKRRNIGNKKIQHIFHEDAMDLMREKMLEMFNKKELFSERRKEIGFYLFCYVVENYIKIENVKIWEKMLIENDAKDGYYQVYFKKRIPISIVVWPSIEKREGKLWLVIFTFLQCKYVDFFCEKNRDFIKKWMQENLIETRENLKCYIYSL